MENGGALCDRCRVGFFSEENPTLKVSLR